MHIAVNKRNGIPYASVMTSVREGKTVKKKSVMYLGRVLGKLFKTPISERWGKQICLNE